MPSFLRERADLGARGGERFDQDAPVVPATRRRESGLVDAEVSLHEMEDRVGLSGGGGQRERAHDGERTLRAVLLEGTAGLDRE